MGTHTKVIGALDKFGADDGFGLLTCGGSRLALLRLGVKIDDPGNLRRAYDALRQDAAASLDVFSLAVLLSPGAQHSAAASAAALIGSNCTVTQDTGHSCSRISSRGGRQTATRASTPLPPSQVLSGVVLTATAGGAAPTRAITGSYRDRADGTPSVAAKPAAGQPRRSLAVPQAVTPAPFRDAK